MPAVARRKALLVIEKGGVQPPIVEMEMGKLWRKALKVQIASLHGLQLLRHFWKLRSLER
jgi:hypothetical protein